MKTVIENLLAEYDMSNSAFAKALQEALQEARAEQPAQRTWVGLTDEEIERCMKQAYATVQGRNLERAFAHAIEAKLREKNGIKWDA